MSADFTGLTKNNWPGTWSPSGTFPIALDTEIRGGLQSISGTLNDQLTNIPGQRLTEGMLVYLKNGYGTRAANTYYTYKIVSGDSPRNNSGALPNYEANWTVSDLGSTAVPVAAPVFTGYDNEIHVSAATEGDDGTGNGDLLKPFKTIQKALDLIAEESPNGIRKTIIVHPGTYNESPSITVRSTILNSYSPLGGTTIIQGTLTTSVGCTIAGFQIGNLNITTLANFGDPHIIDCTITGTLTKSGSAAFTEIHHCDINAACNVTGSGLVTIDDCNLNFLNVNHATANVLVRNNPSCRAPVLSAGRLSLINCIVIAVVTNGITTSPNSIINIADCQIVTTALNVVAPIVLNGFYSIFNVVYDKPNSTLAVSSSTGGSTNSVDYFQYINADRLIFDGVNNGAGNAFETTLSVVEPTEDRAIILPNASGTVPVYTTAPIAGQVLTSINTNGSTEWITASSERMVNTLVSRDSGGKSSFFEVGIVDNYDLETNYIRSENRGFELGPDIAISPHNGLLSFTSHTLQGGSNQKTYTFPSHSGTVAVYTALPTESGQSLISTGLGNFLTWEKISINSLIEQDTETPSSLLVAPFSGSSNSILYTALTTGVIGDSYSIRYLGPLNQALTTVSVNNNQIVVTLAAKARMIVSGAGFSQVNGTYIYNGLVTLNGVQVKQWKLDNGWPDTPGAIKATISFVGSLNGYGSWGIWYDDVQKYLSAFVYYSVQPNPELAIYSPTGGSPTPSPSVAAAVCSETQVITAFDGNTLVTASPSGLTTGANAVTAPVYLTGGAGLTSINDVLTWNGTAWVALPSAAGVPSLGSGQIFVGGTNGAATSVTMSGDVSINVSGETTVTGLAGKANLSGCTFTGTVNGITKSMVGLGNVTDESKGTMFSSPTFTGTPLSTTAVAGTNNTQVATTAFVGTAISKKVSSDITGLPTAAAATQITNIIQLTQAGYNLIVPVESSTLYIII